MDSRKALFAILGSIALSTVLAFLLSFYKGSSHGKKISEESLENAETAEKTIQDSVNNVKKRVKKMGEDTERMVNEGGITE